MKSLRLVLSTIIASLLFVSAFAAPGATVVGVKGSVAAQAGELIPVGGVVRTGAGSEVTLRTFDGVVTIVQENSELSVSEVKSDTANGVVRAETTIFDLRSGGVVVSIDPAKKGVTRFEVRTPRGVARANGTVFSVRITQNQDKATLSTMSGTVVFVTDRGEIAVNLGQSITTGGAVQSVADAVAADPSLAAVFSEAALSIAQSVASGAITNTSDSPNLVAGILAAVVSVAAQADPQNAASIASTVVATVGSADLTLNQLITQAAVSPAVDAPSPTSNVILPVLDQTNVVVSPSQP